MNDPAILKIMCVTDAEGDLGVAYSCVYGRRGGVKQVGTSGFGSGRAAGDRG